MLEHYWQVHGMQRYTVLGLQAGRLTSRAVLFETVISNSLESLLRQADFVVTVEDGSEFDHLFRRHNMQKRLFLRVSTLAIAALAATSSPAQDNKFRIGLILPMTGQQASTGRQIEAAAKLYMAQNGDTVAGKKIELIVKDDTSIPDVTKRLAQELVVNDKVNVLAGFGITPSALATAPIATQSKTPLVVMAAATSSITQASPYVVRTSFTLAQAAVAMGDWAPKNGIKKVVTLVSDYGPGIDAEKYFKERFVLSGGQVSESLRVPLRNPDFAPFLQKVRDLKPDALFVFVPSGAGAAVMKQFLERGMDKAGIKLIGTGDVTDDDQLNDMGDGALGVVTSHHYSASHPSALNKKFVEAFGKANKGMRPNFMAVGGYDGMRVIYEALKATKGQGGGDALLAAMKGQIFESPRGPMFIDAQTRDVVQNIYLRKVEKQMGQLYNVEFDVIKDVKDPGKTK
jgi:branched-chain amino acid transport system substrate-binding protein